jgi:hypothetical protein
MHAGCTLADAALAMTYFRAAASFPKSLGTQKAPIMHQKLQQSCKPWLAPLRNNNRHSKQEGQETNPRRTKEINLDEEDELRLERNERGRIRSVHKTK